MSNIIDAYIYNGKAETKPLYQYDYGQILKFHKITLPEAYEVHFATKTNSKTSYIAIGGPNGVLIPDEVLREPGISFAWLFLHTGNDDGETRVTVIIPVIERAGINVIEPTPAERTTIDELIGALDDAVDKCEDNVAHYPKIVDDYWYVWDAANEVWVNTEVSAHGERGAQGPVGPAGVDGQNGQDGADGQDGFSPIANVSKSGATATITITDSSGTTTAEISDGSFENLIDDSNTGLDKTWSSEKVDGELNGKIDAENPTGSGAVSIGRKANSSVGMYSSAVGYNVSAEQECSHAEGKNTTSTGIGSHVEGFNSEAHGEASHAEGYGTNALGYYSHAEGTNTQAYGDNSHSEGYVTVARGDNSHAEGFSTEAYGDCSHVEGSINHANGDYSHAEGYNVLAEGNYSHAEGEYTRSEGEGSHAEGTGTLADGYGAHAEGGASRAEGYLSHAEGDGAYASGYVSHAEGYATKAYGDCSHAQGYDTEAHVDRQFVFVSYNEIDYSNEFVEIVGNGSNGNNRSNARTLDWQGNEVIAGKLTINGTPSEPNDVARLQDIKLDYTDIIDFPAVSVPHNTSLVNVGYFTLNKGKYLLHAVLRFAGISNGQGRRHMHLSRDMSGNFYGSGYFAQTDSVAIGNEPVFLNEFTMVTIPSDNSPLYIMAFQTNVGQNYIEVIPRIQYCKISD